LLQLGLGCLGHGVRLLFVEFVGFNADAIMFFYVGYTVEFPSI
jgi:hypothetical protein